jgi:acyl carrier protein
MLVTPDSVLLTVAREASLDPEKVSPQSTIAELDITSLDLVSILFSLEEQFGIEIAPEDVSQSWTVTEFYNYVAALAAK